MRKIKSYIWAVIAALAAVCCFGLVACGNTDTPNTPSGGDNTDPPDQTVTYSIVWNIGEHATVVADGYDTLPTKLASGTEVTFTVTMDDGWELLAVAPTTSISHEDDSYKFTLSRDLEVRVLTQESEPAETLYTVTWNVADNVTVSAAGYDTLPTTLAFGTIVKFSATVDDETLVVAVAPLTVVKQSDGTYIFAVAGDITIDITATAKTELTVIVPQDTTYYAGDDVYADGFTVKATDVSGATRELDTDEYTVEYQTNANGFALGDTEFTVRYGGNEKTVVLDAPIVGKIVLNYFSYTVEASELNDLTDAIGNFDLDETAGTISWTFSEPFENDVVLPKIVAGAELKFAGWGADNITKIAAGTDTSLWLSVNFVPAPYIIQEIYFDYSTTRVSETIDDYTRSVWLTPFVIRGKFVGANTVSIELVDYDGVSYEYDSVTRDATNDEFMLTVDIRDIIEKYGDSTHSWETFWVEIHAVGEDGVEHVDRIDCEEYGDDVFPAEVNGDKRPMSTYYALRTKNYAMSYHTETNDVNGKSTDLGVVLLINKLGNYMYNDAEIVVEDNVPYLEITGSFYMSYVRSEAEEILNNLVADICEFNVWNNTMRFTQSATLNDNWYFTLRIDISKLEYGKTFVMHANTAQTNGDTDKNLMFSSSNFGRTVTCGDVQYMLVEYETGWNYDWPAIQVVNPNRALNVTSVSINAIDDKPYMSVTYSYLGYTQAEIEALPVNFDLQVNNNIKGGGWTRHFFDDKISFMIDEENNTFDVRIDISSLRNAYGYTMHFSLNKEEGDREGETNNPADFKPDIAGFRKSPVACGDFEYKLIYVKGSTEGSEYWGCVGLEMTDISGKEMNVDTTLTIGVENEQEAFLIISGTYSGYSSADAFKADIVIDGENADSWAKTVFPADSIEVSLDSSTNTFFVKVNITDMAAGKYLIHFNGKDIGNENGIDAIACGDKTFAYTFKNFGTWTRYVLTVTETTSDTEVTPE